jgi:hypothetical protein
VDIDQETRTRFQALTEDVVGGPDLARAVADGRRHRRHRRLVRGAAVVAVVGVAAGTAFRLAGGPGDTVAVDRPADQPSYHDFVPGTQVDEQIQAAAADHLAGLTDATDVFPSDWNHDAMNPPVDYQNATEWQAYYEPTPNDHTVVFTSKKVPNEPQQRDCSETPAGPYCSTSTLPDGSTLLTHAYYVDSGPYTYWFADFLVRPDGSVASVVEHVQADSWAQAEQRREFTDAEIKGLVDDPRLIFPDPLDPPPPPKGW